ncbi:hypothetical protein L7F22_042413 [Adiantum nelumboides]|nr:hypothetical protein [Adiantum nelumboides]
MEAAKLEAYQNLVKITQDLLEKQKPKPKAMPKPKELEVEKTNEKTKVAKEPHFETQEPELVVPDSEDALDGIPFVEEAWPRHLWEKAREINDESISLKSAPIEEAVIANGPFEKWGIDAMGPLPRTANGKLYILVAIDYMTRFGTPLEIVSDNGPGFRRGLLTEAVIANGPFEKWGIDAMGPLPRTANGKLYILVAIDYMTRFGTPLEIVSDNGPGFRRGLLTEVCEELKISHRHSTPYYPQSNGLVEKANGIIAGIIRKMVESKPKRWDNFLDGAIWAYRTTYRDATQFTPFHLVYGQEALQPIELNIPTIKLTGDGKDGLLGYTEHLEMRGLNAERQRNFLAMENIQLKKLNEACSQKILSNKETIQGFEKKITSLREKDIVLGSRKRKQDLCNIENMKIDSGGLKKQIRVLK